MTAKLLDGKAIAQDIRTEITHRVAALHARTGVTPMLSVILVGQNPASRVYVRNKIKACADAGIRSALHEFPADVDPAEVIARIDALNRDPQVHGILVQLPLPAHHDIHAVLRTIAVEKDVDGFHLYNVGGLVLGETVFPPCTPYGVMKLLEFGQHRRRRQERHHRRRQQHRRQADGADDAAARGDGRHLPRAHARPRPIHHPGRHPDRRRRRAQPDHPADGEDRRGGHRRRHQPAADGRLVGDIDFEGVRKKAAYVTPVPGGIGPMTVTMLLENTLVAAERATLGAATVAPVDEALEQAE